MSYSIKLSLSLIALILAVGVISPVFAQETPEVTEAINLDEVVEAKDLEISEPTLLPDSPFYFLKNWGRTIQFFFTFDPIKKAELRSKFADEKIIEAKKIAEKTDDPEKIKNAVENYQKEMQKNEAEADKLQKRIQERIELKEEAGKFLDKFIQHQLLHQKILTRLESQIPSQAFTEIKEARERHLEMFGQVMQKLEEKDKILERLEENMEEIKGSKFKNFKNLEVLKDLEEKVPEEVKPAIRKAQENALKRLKGDLEKMSPEDQESFKDYLEKISGDKQKQMEILENLNKELRAKPEIRKKVIQSKDRILEKIKQKATGKPEIVCSTLWDPVCGKNGKTYSNSCFIKLAGVDIEYKGVCK